MRDCAYEVYAAVFEVEANCRQDRRDHRDDRPRLGSNVGSTRCQAQFDQIWLQTLAHPEQEQRCGNTDCEGPRIDRVDRRSEPAEHFGPVIATRRNADEVIVPPEDARGGLNGRERRRGGKVFVQRNCEKRDICEKVSERERERE